MKMDKNELFKAVYLMPMYNHMDFTRKFVNFEVLVFSVRPIVYAHLTLPHVYLCPEHCLRHGHACLENGQLIQSKKGASTVLPHTTGKQEKGNSRGKYCVVLIILRSGWSSTGIN